MDFSKIVIAPKLSKFQWDMKRFGLTRSQLLAKYRKEGVDADKMVASHHRQKKSFEIIQKLFRSSKYLYRSEFGSHRIRGAQLVISLGGDNHFQFVSHFIKDKLMVGINSDSKQSEGALTTLFVHQAEKLARSLRQDDYGEEEWTRIQIVLNGKRLPVLAVSEVFMGETMRCHMSRHILRFRGKVEEQKCSGLLISTGAGSTGWYDSASRFYFPRGNTYPKTEESLRFLSTEPYSGKLSGKQMIHGKIRRSENFLVRSLNDTRGVLLIDSERKYPFQEGASAVISMGRPLRILTI